MQKSEFFSTPILLLIFNRPDETKQVFERIRAVKPKYLFVAADGPRENNEQDYAKCKLTRDIVKSIDWDCDLKTLFREQNLGCGIAPSSAISWFFDQVDEGIILEDDCVPLENFFSFCQSALEHYRDEKKVMHIAGLNNLPIKLKIKESAYISAIPFGWGWATWKRAWDSYSYNISDLENATKSEFLSYYFKEPAIINYWLNIFKELEVEQNHIWDYQWLYYIWINKGLSVLPKLNLIKNIGFNENATHTKTSFIKEISNTTSLTPPFVFPNKLEINVKADNMYLTHYIYKKPSLFEKAKRKLKKKILNWKHISI